MAGLDWNLIRSFVAVAETGSLSAAARQLDASQPTLGRHIADLEAKLDVVLFRRGRKGYDLTEQGMALLGRGRGVAEHATAFARLALGTAEQVAGTVRITASEMVAIYVLPPILAELAVAEPDIEVEIVASNQVDNLLRRDADIAVRMVKPAQNELVARKVCDIPLVACATTSYLDRRGRPEQPSDLTRHQLIGFDRDEALVAGMTALGVAVDRHHFRVRSDSHAMLWQAVRAGNGIGFAQRGLVRQAPELEIVLPKMPLPVLPTWLALHRDVRSSPRIRRVADILHAGLKRYADS